LILPAAEIASAFSLALFGGLHCAGMCGGFIGALQMNRPPKVSGAGLALGYHTGRIISYTLAGALLGLIGGSLFTTGVLPLQVVLLVVGAAMLLVIGLSLLGSGAWMKRIEPIGAWLWRLIAPVARHLYPPQSGLQALAAGLAWGWIPCGMVYAALPLSLVAGGWLPGALVMLAFGVGTLPNLILVDAAVIRFGSPGKTGAMGGAKAWLRPLAGALILVFGISGLAHAARVAGAQHPAIAALASICHPAR
jgi:sulfite exporter TauE/SafE